MDGPGRLEGLEDHRRRRNLRCIVLLAVFMGCGLRAAPGFGVEVPVRDGQSVKVKLRNVLTTDNVRKGDAIEFEVSQDVLVNGHVVIAKGAIARGKIVDVKGAFKPRASDAEVAFEFTSVAAADQHDLPLRLQPERPRKGSENKNIEVHEKSEIPGQISRVVGADKGKEYQVYVNGSFTVNASDAPVPAPAAPAAAVASAPVAAPAAASPLAATDVTLGPSSVQFDSTPDGAKIVIDGNEVGNTPSNLRMTPGHHTLEIRMAGYRTWSRTMVVDPESHPSVRATLVPQ